MAFPTRTRTYDYSVPLESMEHFARLDGLALLRAIIAGDLPAPPIAATLGFALVEADRGRAVFSGTAAVWQYNPLGVVHGGWISTLLDSAMACSVHSTLDAGDRYTTLDLQVRFLRAVVEATGELRAEAVAVHTGKRVGTAEGRLIGADGTLYATATTSCLIMR